MSSAVRSLVAREGIGFTANVVQHSTLRFSQVAVESAALIFLRHGKKTLKTGSHQWNAESGDAIVIAGGQFLDIMNQLSPEGFYEARWVVWDSGLIDQVRSYGYAARPLSGAVVVKDVNDGFSSAMDRAVEAICKPSEIPDAIARHRLVELLLWLAENDVTLATQQATTAAAKLRRLVTGSLSAVWTVSGAAEHLAISEATLRRRLKAEGTTFGEVLTDARMSSAMTLLQSTNRAVSHIASDVGYESASRFSVRFRARFGFAPSAVRGHRR